MKKIIQPLTVFLLSIFSFTHIFAQTSWKGITSTNWATATNWTAGVPLATTDVIIGDANFTGAFQPAISATAAAKTLTIGGSIAAQLTVASTLTVKGDIIINANGGIINGNASISLTGNWNNSGTYNTSSTASTVTFNGTAQTLGGSAVTTFRKLTVNTGTVLTLTNNVNCTGASSLLTVNGTLNPNEPTTYLATADNLIVNSAAVLKVNAAVFSSNYIINTLFTVAAGSIVEYSATTIDQTISSAYIYSTLRISGAGMTKSLAADLPLLRSTAASTGNIYVLSGTLNLAGYLAARGTTVAGGTLSISNAAFLKIGGTNGFPSGYTTNTLNLTSTVEYNGGDQPVSSKTYGNLVLSSASGLATKTLPATVFTVSGSLTSNVGAGAAVNYTAASNITVTGSVNIGPATTFDGATFSHVITGNWNNNGTFIPSTSTITLKGASTSINGNAIQPFNNLTITGSNVTSPAITTINIAGNFATSGSGTFTNTSPGTFNMTGATKTFGGIGITLNNFAVSGTVTSTATCILTGDASVTGSMIASSGTFTMNGSGKAISNSGTLTFKALIASGSINTTSNFSVSSSLNCTGSFTATANTITFTSASLLSGTANFFNVEINGTTLSLASNAVMGIANSFFITTGTFNVTSYIPNTVIYNGSINQNVKGGAYNNLTFSNGGTKTALAAITVNNGLTISPATTFDPLNFTQTIIGNFTNNGIFIPNSGIVQFTGATNAVITGATTFYGLTVNKSSATYGVTLANNITAYAVAMTAGGMKTGSNTLTITSATTGRTGAGIILGTITRTHAFTTGVAYAFEGLNNTVIFASVTGVTSVTVNVTVATVADFPFGGAITRYYNISIPSGAYTATLRLHYEDAELNGNDENVMQLWKYNGTAWAASGKTAFSPTNNYIEKSGLTNLNDRWTLTDDGSVLNWNGSVSSDWSDGSNWTLVQGTFSGAPLSTDIAQIGVVPFTNQPAINTTATVKAITFGSVQAATLTMTAPGSLTTGSINGIWSANATHTINTNAQNINVNGDLVLSDNTNGHAINFNIGTGTITVTGNVVQSGAANIIFSGTGTLSIGKDYNYTNGTFTAGTGTVKYTGTVSQTVAPVNYYNLTIAKTAGTVATLSNNCNVAGGLTVTTGELDIASTVNITGTVTISGTSILDGNAANLNVTGNWSKAAAATFNAGNGTVSMVGSGAQTVTAGAFNVFTVNKTAGTVTLSGNNTLNGNLNLLAGTLNLSTFTFNQSSAGDIFTIADNTTLLLSGASNFPSNFVTYTIGTNSLVHYNGVVAQTVADVTYGNLTFSNGASLAKTFSGSSTVNGNITINSGATLNGGSNFITLNGNWLNSGSFNGGTGDILLNGTNKTLTGNTIFYDVTVNGSYTVANSDITFNGQVQVTPTGSYTAGTGVATVNGDFTNAGSVTSAGTTTFSGTALQNIRLVNALVSTSTGIVNFNGSVSPAFNSTSTPIYATLNINNTGGINPSVNWVVLGPFTVSNGASFNGGIYTHTFSRNFTNNGTVTSTGILNFNPSTPATVQLAGTTFSSTGAGTVIFGGSAPLTITSAATTFQNIIIANTNPAGITAPAAWTVNGNFSINSDAIFNAGSYIHTVSGDIESDGILNGNTSTFIMNSSNGSLSGSPGTVFNNFSVNGTVTANSDFNVAADFMNNGTYDGSIGALTMAGSGPSVIGGSTTPSPIALLTVNKTGGAVVTDNVNIGNISALIINSGTLFTSTYSIAQNPAGGAIIIMAAGTLKLGGTNTIPAFSGYNFDVQSTVDYAGTTQTIANGPVYGNLVISSTGNKTAPSFLPLTVAGNFTVTAGNFIANNNLHSIAGNWLMTGGTFTNTNSIIRFNGAANQSIQTIAPFNSITINKTAGLVNLSSDITVNSTLNFILGKIQTGNYNVVIPSSASVTGAAQNTGWVKGNLQKNIATGTAVSRTFEVGDAVYYTPATVLFATVGTAGNLTGYVTATEHSQIDYSGIDSSKSVNRFWTFTNAGTIFTTAASTFNWVATDADAGANTANFKTATYNAGNWGLNSVAAPTATSIQATGITAFGDFAIGERVSSYKWTGDAFTDDWATAKNWKGGIPTINLSVLIPAGITGGRFYPVLSTGAGTVNNLGIDLNASLTVTSGTLQVAGTVSNSGTLDVSNGTVEFNGSSAQTISAGLFTNNKIKNLIISNNVSLATEDTLTGTLSVNAGKTFATNDNLVLRSDANGTARIATLPANGFGIATAFITGKVSIERFIPMRKAWRLLSAPVKATGAPTINDAWQEGTSTSSFVANPNPGYGVLIGGGPTTNGFDQAPSSNPFLRVYNSATNTFTALPATPGTFRPISDYPGYFLYIRGDRSIDLTQGSSAAITSTTLRMKGQVNTGNQVTNVNATSYTLLGNPYASAIDFETLIKNNVKNSFYVWDPKLAGNYGLGAYVSFSWNSGTGMYDATTSASPLSKYIPSGEAILIESADGVNPGTITIKESDKTSNGSDAVFGRITPVTIPTLNQQVRVNLYAVNTDASVSLLDAVLTTYHDHNTNALDNNDAKKLSGSSENIGIKREDKMLSIERRKTITVSDTSFLNIYQMKIAKYQLQVVVDNMNRNGMTAVIKDKYSNTINNMQLDMNGMTKVDFSINSDPASYAKDRFSIVFLPHTRNQLATQVHKAYRLQNDIAVEWKTENVPNTSTYEVERSADGKVFSSINATVSKGETAAYKVLDVNPLNSDNYYRIRTIDKNNKATYSEVLKVNKQDEKLVPSIVVYPNPVTGNTITMQVNNMEQGNYNLQLYNAAGQLIASKAIQHTGNSTAESLDVNTGFTAGKYELKLTGDSVKIATGVIKN